MEDLVTQGDARARLQPSSLLSRVVASVRAHGVGTLFVTAWAMAWLRLSHMGLGRPALHLAALGTPPYYGRHRLARLHPRGYVSPRARVHHKRLRLGRNVFIGDDVVMYEVGKSSGGVQLDDNVVLDEGVVVQTGHHGGVHIAEGAHIQPRCQLSAYKAAINIGRRVQIGPACAFYPYDHGTAAGQSIVDQPLTTRGPITICDDAWLGYGAIVLSGVRIGTGAVVGAGAVVTHDVPDGSVAVGNPARVIKQRGGTRAHVAGREDR